MDVSKRIDAPVEKVWNLLVDTHEWPRWGPSVCAVECSQRIISAGAGGRVRTAVGLWLPFQITSFDAPVYWSWKVAGIPATGHRLEPIDRAHCILTFEIPLGCFPYAIVCRKAAANIARLSET